MNPSIPAQNSEVDIAIDLRLLNVQFDNRDEKRRPIAILRKLWPDISPHLIGKPITAGQKIEVIGQRGMWKLTILDTHGVTLIGDTTRINIVDIERDPEIRHACKKCQQERKTIFGPFFCPECREQNLSDRLCETHARFLENKFTAYCSDHLPHCQCREGCPDSATFECDYCRRPFSDRWKREHPTDKLTLLCQNCYSAHFEICVDCQREGKRRLGKSRCAFPMGAADRRHDKRICTKKHAWQWQVWGPHWRGITLCGEHYHQLSQASVADLLWMLVTAKAPAPFLRKKVTDVYRLKNIVGYVRRKELTWLEIDQVLKKLVIQAAQADMPKYVGDNIEELSRKLAEAQNNSALEMKLLQIVREFYSPHLRSDPATVILDIFIKRVFDQGTPKTYRIGVRVGRDAQGNSMIGRLIGREGRLLEPLKDLLQAYSIEDINFEE